MKKILTYSNFWTRNVCTFLFFYLIMTVQEYLGEPDPELPQYSMLESFFLFSSLYGLLLFNNIVIVKKLLFKRKFVYYIVSTIVFYFFLGSFFYLYSCGQKVQSSYWNNLSIAFFAILIGSAIFFTHTWITDNIIKTKKQLISREAELNFLKSQISPHFLFNALNNLYGTSLVSPEIVTEKILQLSDLLRYQIEALKIDFITLEAEIKYIQKYLDYIQYKSTHLKIEYTKTGETTNFLLPPLLFMPLIENAVKHSFETENPYIEIIWKLNQETIIFTIKNTYLHHNSNTKGTKTGLENLYKRLEILNVKHAILRNLDDVNIYEVSLKLWKTNTNV